MQSKITISVIIPVYNTGEFLEDCLRSILDQQIKGLEIILVDDGSTDNCPQLIKSYSDKYPNIIALHQENQGQGVARNFGLSVAQGEFVAFVDSDDLIPPHAYEAMYSLAVQNHSDMVVGIQQSFNEKRTWKNVPVHKKYFKQAVVNTDIEHASYLLEDISCCNRLISHDLIRQHGLLFPAAAREDLDFTIRLYLFSSKISILPKVVYHYRGRVGSDTDTIQSVYFRDWVDIVETLKPVFRSSRRETLLPVLLRSEMRKLVVQSRFSKIIRDTEYPERMKIFQLLSSLAQQLTVKEISESGYFSLKEQVRIFMLQQEEYGCLEMFEKKPWSPGYLAFFEQRESCQKVSEPLLRMYMQKIRRLNHDKRANAATSLPSLFSRLSPQVTKLYRRLLQAGQRRRKAGIPLSALLYYFVLYPFTELLNLCCKNKQIWLIDERLSRSAGDNGFFLFQYLREQVPELRVYYVISADSPDRERVEQLGQVVLQYSTLHAYYLLRAQVLLSTDSLRSLAFPAEIFRRLWCRTHNVFLQHGIMSVKRTIYSHKNYFYLSQIITSSSQEKNIFIQDYDFPEQTITVTGLARFDNLAANRVVHKNRQVLVVPTWRLGLSTPQQVKASKYLWAWRQLLACRKLVDLLTQHQATLLFCPHHNMLPFAVDFSIDSDRIAIQTNNTPPLYRLIKESALLITDYSSVMFDFFYQNKPAICYMFDRREVECSQGGGAHIDIDNDLPADVYDTVGGVLSSLSWYLENDCRMPGKHQVKVGNFFQYRDNENCKRIYQAVLNRFNE